MRIAELTAFHVHIPLRKTIRHASHSRRGTDSLLVRCRLSDGAEGWGEGLPRSYVTGETIETVWQQWQQTDWKRELGEPFDSLSDAIDLCSRFQMAIPADAERDCFGNSLRCAVELSVLAAATQALGVPLSQVVSEVPETIAIRKSQDQVRYSGAVTSLPPFQEFLMAWKLKLFGFSQVKVKVGVPQRDDERTLRRLRRILGLQVDLRIDANEAWNCQNLEAHWNRLNRFRISSLEQPVRHEEVDGLAVVRPRLGVPIMLDESLCSLSDAYRAIERGTCDLFNIRLSKCGGFLNSLRLAAVAHRAGLGYQLGCQVGESGILSAAGRHFASSISGIRYLEGSYDRFLVKERLTQEDLTFGYGGQAAALNEPGLGVQVDRNAVERVTRRQDPVRMIAS